MRVLCESVKDNQDICQEMKNLVKYVDSFLVLPKLKWLPLDSLGYTVNAAKPASLND